MSRSRKRAVMKIAPVDGSVGKKLANRKVRRTPNIPNGMAYKKVFCSYEIHDWIADLRFGAFPSWLPKGARKEGKKGWTIPK